VIAHICRSHHDAGRRDLEVGITDSLQALIVWRDKECVIDWAGLQADLEVLDRESGPYR
jgi:hypothetical protein